MNQPDRYTLPSIPPPEGSPRSNRSATRLRRRSLKQLTRALRLLPIERRVILFESHRGLSYSDNPKAICEEVLRQGLPVECIWSFGDMTLEVPPGVRKVRRFSPRYYYYHSCARVLVHNGDFGENLPIRSSQVYINTQHGTPLKLMGTDLQDKKPDAYSPDYSKNGRWSHLVSPNRYSSEIFKRVYRYDGPVHEVGYPRNDLFFQRNTPTEIAALKKRWGLPPDKKVILYAPTWRDTGGSKIDRGFQLALDLEALKERFGGEYVIILRLHHLIATALELTEAQRSFAFDFSEPQYDAQELLLAADVLITDYSSMMFDYANLRRPTIFFAYDLDAYTNSIRGTYFDLRTEGPGPVVRTMPELIEALDGIESWRPEYTERELAFHERFCALENGTASKAVVDRLIRPAMGLT
jgi:CDP-glycerol glycerophosphotransferase